MDGFDWLGKTSHSWRDGFVRGEAGKLVEAIRGRNCKPWEIATSYLHSIPEKEAEELFRKRSASEIMRSFHTGTSDQALVFVTLLRAMGMPTEYVEAFSKTRLYGDREYEGRALAVIHAEGQKKLYDPVEGLFNDLEGFECVEIGRGTDFSRLYLRRGTEYLAPPVSLDSIPALRRAADTLLFHERMLPNISRLL